MEIHRVLKDFNHFMVTEYEPGLCIDFSNPPPVSDIDEIRKTLSSDELLEQCDQRAINMVSQFLVELKLAVHKDDFMQGLREFTHEYDTKKAIEAALRILAPGWGQAPCLPGKLNQLLELTGLMDRPAHHATRFFCHVPGTVSHLGDDATHFGFVLDGEPGTLTTNDRCYPLYPSSYFSWSGTARIGGNARIVLISRFGYRGYDHVGGLIADWGALKYIDGCSDSLLVNPVKKGDACLNALYFPPHTVQTRHYHPSIRAGAILAGSGLCRTPEQEYPLTPGHIFFMPAETWHAFETKERRGAERSALTVIAFHPDSDFGPTDENHPMLNRTFFQFLHRLKSKARD